MPKRRSTITILGDDELARTVRIMGPSSAAARAIEERDRRRAAGEEVVCFLDVAHDMIVVGPDPRTGQASVGDTPDPT